jgi:hypothetical protein
MLLSALNMFIGAIVILCSLMTSFLDTPFHPQKNNSKGFFFSPWSLDILLDAPLFIIMVFSPFSHCSPSFPHCFHCFSFISIKFSMFRSLCELGWNISWTKKGYLELKIYHECPPYSRCHVGQLDVTLASLQKRGVHNLIKTIKFESQLGSSKNWIIDQYECEHKQIPFVEGKCVGV